MGGSSGGGQPHSCSVHFVDIMMHALASPSEAFSRHSIFMQLDGAQAGEDEDATVRLVPAEPSQSECHLTLLQQLPCCHSTAYC